MADLRIGVIGAGPIGKVHAANLARHVPDARLAAVADVDRVKAEACAADNGADDAYTSDTELLARIIGGRKQRPWRRDPRTRRLARASTGS